MEEEWAFLFLFNSSSSLPDSQGSSIFFRRCNVHLFLLEHVIDATFLLAGLSGSVTGNSP